MPTQDEIIQMARDAGATAGPITGKLYLDQDENLERFAALIYAAGHKDGQREMRTRVKELPRYDLADVPGTYYGVEMTKAEFGDYVEFSAIEQLEIREPS